MAGGNNHPSSVLVKVTLALDSRTRATGVDGEPEINKPSNFRSALNHLHVYVFSCTKSKNQTLLSICRIRLRHARTNVSVRAPTHIRQTSQQTVNYPHLAKLLSFFQDGSQRRHVRLWITPPATTSITVATSAEEFETAGGMHADGAVEVRVLLDELQSFARLF